MNEFDALSVIIDTAIKHGKHNQKLHGRRGGSYTQTAMDFGDADLSAGGAPPPAAPSLSPVAGSSAVQPATTMDPSTWKAHKPSARALALVREIASGEVNPDGPVARETKKQELEAQIKAGMTQLKKDAEEFDRLKASGASMEELASLDSKYQATFAVVRPLIREYEKIVDTFHVLNVDPRLVLQPGRATIVNNKVRGLQKDLRKRGHWDYAQDLEPKIKAVDEGVSAFHSVTGVKDPLNGFKGSIESNLNGSPGGYFSGINRVKKIFVSGAGLREDKKDAASIVVHEMTHFLENVNPKIAAATMAFHDARTAGEQPRTMNQIWSERTGLPEHRGPYPENVVGKADKYPNLYTGREYRSWNGKMETTEVLSSGVELLLTDPVGFARSDPEYFTFVIDTIQDPSMYGG